tara:strand:- start:845 stop:1294 length:450 start_codon:yes stop_codon:yes gene_type:complete
MNNLIKVTGISVVVLTAAYAYISISSDKQSGQVKPLTEANDHLVSPELIKPSNDLIKSENQAAEPHIQEQAIARSSQQQRVAPPSIDQPTVKELQVKVYPRQLNRMAPPPPLAPGVTADTRHKQDRGHGHEHQENTDNNSQPPPRGADL